MEAATTSDASAKERGARVKVAHIATVDLSLRYLLLNQMPALKARGYDVTAMSAPGPEIRAVENAGIRYVPVEMQRRFAPVADLHALWKLFRLFRRERFTIVHTHTPKAALLGQYAALLARVPIRVHTIHGLYFPGHMKPSRRWLYVLLEKITMMFSHMNLSQNPEDVPVAVREQICGPERISLLGNAVEVAKFDPAAYSPERRLELRRSLGLSPEDKVVGVVARFVVEKGHLEVLEAAKSVRARIPSARFLFIGGAEPAKADALDPSIIDKFGLTGTVMFLGHRSDIADLYSVMDLLVLASHREGFPRVPMEGAAMGVPAVVTNIRGCRQTVDDGVTGLLVPVRNPEALAEAIIQLLLDDEKRLRFGKAAREKALADFDERKLFPRVIETYEYLLRKHGGK